MTRRFTVAGRTVAFPMRMLGRDRCWPESEEDAEKIASSYGDRSGRQRRWEITLNSDLDRAPSIEQWKKYGLTVVHQEHTHEGSDEATD